jgi:Flp pilus assembly protein TadG
VAVELALLTVPLVLLTLGAIEFARIVLTYNQLVKVTRDGARLLSGFNPETPADYPIAAVKSRMQVVPGLSPSMIQVCDRIDATACPGLTFANVPTGLGSVNLVRVQVNGYQYEPVFPLANLLPSVRFDTISTTMRQVL